MALHGERFLARLFSAENTHPNLVTTAKMPYKLTKGFLKGLLYRLPKGVFYDGPIMGYKIARNTGNEMNKAWKERQERANKKDSVSYRSSQHQLPTIKILQPKKKR
jgi:hypothetical protein